MRAVGKTFLALYSVILSVFSPLKSIELQSSDKNTGWSEEEAQCVNFQTLRNVCVWFVILGL